MKSYSKIRVLFFYTSEFSSVCRSKHILLSSPSAHRLSKLPLHPPPLPIPPGTLTKVWLGVSSAKTQEITAVLFPLSACFETQSVFLCLYRHVCVDLGQGVCFSVCMCVFVFPSSLSGPCDAAQRSPLLLHTRFQFS